MIMITSISITVLLVFSLTSVTCEDSVEGFIGEDVILPCSYDARLSADVKVFWRNRDDSVVLDIMKSSEDYTSQNQKYKGRVSSFPAQYMEGNFSIIMKNLQKDDADTYECFIQTVRYRKYIKLSVSDKPPVKAAETIPPRDGAGGLTFHQVVLLSALCLLLCF